MFPEDIWRSLATLLRLSQRETEILQAVFDDQKESSIAANLGISTHTVHSHLERLYRKIGVSSRVALVVRVVRMYLLVLCQPESKQVPRPSAASRSIGRPADP